MPAARKACRLGKSPVTFKAELARLVKLTADNKSNRDILKGVLLRLKRANNTGCR